MKANKIFGSEGKIIADRAFSVAGLKQQKYLPIDLRVSDLHRLLRVPYLDNIFTYLFQVTTVIHTIVVLPV